MIELFPLKPVIIAAQISIAILALAALIGGVIGYLKAGSKVSLVAGASSGLVLAGSLWWSFENLKAALAAAAVLAMLLEVLFALRLAKTRKFMPAGMMAVLAGLCLAAVIITIATTP